MTSASSTMQSKYQFSLLSKFCILIHTISAEIRAHFLAFSHVRSSTIAQCCTTVYLAVWPNIWIIPKFICIVELRCNIRENWIKFFLLDTWAFRLARLRVVASINSPLMQSSDSAKRAQLKQEAQSAIGMVIIANQNRSLEKSEEMLYSQLTSGE